MPKEKSQNNVLLNMNRQNNYSNNKIYETRLRSGQQTSICKPIALTQNPEHKTDLDISDEGVGRSQSALEKTLNFVLISFGVIGVVSQVVH